MHGACDGIQGYGGIDVKIFQVVCRFCYWFVEAVNLEVGVCHSFLHHMRSISHTELELLARMLLKRTFILLTTFRLSIAHFVAKNPALFFPFCRICYENIYIYKYYI